MNRRSHVTELGCISCEEHIDIRAGKEGSGPNCPRSRPSTSPPSARILRIRVQGMKKDLGPNDSEEVSTMMPGVIAQFNGSEIQSMLQRWFQQANDHFWDENVGRNYLHEMGSSFVRLSYQLWDVNKFGSKMAMPSVAYTLLSSKMGSSLKLFWSEYSRYGGASNHQQRNQKSNLNHLHEDHPRKGEKRTLSPSGTLAAITDSLGRILLLDTQALVDVRLWKGYRDASCLFMEMLVNRNSGDSSSLNLETTKSDYSLSLAIHTPRKGIIEVWQMRTGLGWWLSRVPKDARYCSRLTGTSNSR
ncbi:hypothetical protein MLD38_021974 [Melastoma candidum]|uniref:Uncharacterized protein n=1 Tax=Melastoma candidum TaxID=119954 RepID=A0ACB9QI93_9MYRT|nr:hypothetical protein MLD38_021974 [Melastoma candidum]